jgi:hypothetical protein
VAGLHEYVVAPPAVSVVELPEHIAVEGETVTVGGAVTVITTVCVALQLPVVPVTVYVVVEPGLAVGLGQLVHVNDVVGDHV